MSETTREEALKERIEIISSTVCLHVVDHNSSRDNGHVKTFMKSEAVKAESFRKGYIAALKIESETKPTYE